MSHNRSKDKKAESQTGAIPKLNLPVKSRREPIKPATLPEFDDEHGASTGAIIIRAEGEDRAKDADDTPTKSAVIN